MYKKKYSYWFSPEDEVIVELAFPEPGQPSQVSVQYRARIGGAWLDVVRYDNRHGSPHRHRAWEPGRVRRLPLRLEPTGLVDFARQDLKRSWRKYRAIAEALQ